MRIFVSYNTRDMATAERVVQALGVAMPGFDSYFAPRSNIGGAYWLPKLGEELRRSDVVLILLGARVGTWQELEYYEALRLSRAGGVPRIVPVLLGEESPGLWFLSQFHRLRMDRQPFAALIEQLKAALAGAEVGGDRVPPWRETNPYRGLKAMGSADAAWFFGREALTGEILEALRTRRDRVLALVGNSGVGKSSLVEAGVLAALRSQLWPGDQDRAWPADLRDSRSWLALTIRPGEQPLKALALGFVRSWLDDPADAEAQAMKWVSNFRSGSDLGALAEAARHAIAQCTAAQPPARILLYVDQGEELYARSEPGEAARFSELLSGATGRAGIAVMASLRSDYYGRLQEDVPLFAASERIDVPPLGRTEIEAVIHRPADRLGAQFEALEIVPLIADATARESGALPLLSFMMSEAWEVMRRDEASDGVLRFPLGVIDVAGPLVRRAMQFIELHPGDEATLRRLFTLRLAHVAKEGEPVRRRATRADCSLEEWKLAQELASEDWRLLTTGSEGGEPTVEVAHETLLRKWPRLAGWIDQERKFLIWRGQLEFDRRDWETAPPEKKDAAVLMGLALDNAKHWLGIRRDEITEADTAFINSSVELDQARLANEAWREAELADERAQREALARERAEQELELARERVQREALAREKAEREVQLTQERAQREALGRQHAEKEAELVLARAEREAELAKRRRWITWGAVAAAVIFALLGSVAGWQWHRAAERVAAAHRNDSLLLAQLSKEATARGNAVDGMLLALQGLPTSFDAGSWTTWLSSDQPNRPLVPDTVGALIEAMSNQRELVVWEQGVPFPPEQARQILAVARTPPRVLALGKETVRLFDLENGSTIGELESVDDWGVHPMGLIVDEVNNRIITTRSYMGIDFWNLDDFEHLRYVQIQSKLPVSLTSSEDGTIVAAGSEDYNVYMIDAITMEQVGYLHEGEKINEIAFSPDGRHLASVLATGKISIWSSGDWRSMDGRAGHKQLTLPDRFGYEDPVRVAFASDGKKIAVAYQRGGVLVWNLPKSDRASGQGAGGESEQPMLQDIEGLKGSASSVLFPAAGNVLAAGFADGSIRIVDLDIRPQAAVEHMMAGTTPIVDLAFADGERLISLDMAGTIRFWAAAPRYHLRAKLSSSSYSDDCVAFSGESYLVVRRRPGEDIFDFPETRLYELEASGLGAVTRQESWGLGDLPSGRPCEEFPSSRRLPNTEEDARHSFGGQLGEGKPAIERPRVSLHIEDLVDGLEPVVTRNGEAIVGATRDGRLSVWDSAGTRTATWNLTSPVAQLELSPNDRIILARLASGDLLLWPMANSIEELIDIARSRLPRCLTSDEAGTAGLAGC